MIIDGIFEELFEKRKDEKSLIENFIGVNLKNRVINLNCKKYNLNFLFNCNEKGELKRFIGTNSTGETINYSTDDYLINTNNLKLKINDNNLIFETKDTITVKYGNKCELLGIDYKFFDNGTVDFYQSKFGIDSSSKTYTKIESDKLKSKFNGLSNQYIQIFEDGKLVRSEIFGRAYINYERNNEGVLRKISITSVDFHKYLNSTNIELEVYVPGTI